jgi:DNA repair exonuclease SbcCD ATPase subunit
MSEVDVPESARSARGESAADVASLGEDMKEAGEARRRLSALREQLQRLEQKDQLTQKLEELHDRLDAVNKLVTSTRAQSTESKQQLVDELAQRLELVTYLSKDLKARVEERDKVVRHAVAGERAASRRRLWPLVERIALSLAVAGGVGGLFEYWNNHQKERREAAQTTYREVWAKYADFMTACMDHPKLDCHTIPVDDESMAAFTAEDAQQQTRLDTILIDTLEFAYKQYEDPDFKAAAGPSYADEWPGWEVYVKKHLVRDHFRRTWCTIRDEYASTFVPWMDRWMSEVGQSCSATAPAAPNNDAH